MGLEGWLGLTHVFSATVWASALLAIAARRGVETPRSLSMAAGVSAFGAVFSGVWLLHHTPALLTMTHMHVKAAALLALGALDHLLVRGHRPRPMTGRSLRIGAVAVVILAIGLATVVGPEAA